jgi:hypothetical protein
MPTHKALLGELERSHNKLYSLLRAKVHYILHEFLMYGEFDHTHNLRVHRTVSVKVGAAIIPVDIFLIYEGEVQVAAKWADRVDTNWYIWKGGLVNISQVGELLDLLGLVEQELEVKAHYLEKVDQYKTQLDSALGRLERSPYA